MRGDGSAVQMVTTGLDLPECDNNTTSGRAGADGLCRARYSVDVANVARSRINMERGGAELHRAVLADMSLVPQSFAIPNETDREFRRTLDLALISDYATFFMDGTDVTATITGAALSIYWTGFGDDFIFDTMNNCGNWSDDTSGNGRVGFGTNAGRSRLRAGNYSCNTYKQILCITY